MYQPSRIIKILYIAKGFNEKVCRDMLEIATLPLEHLRSVRCVFTFLSSSILGLSSTQSTYYDIIFVEHDIPFLPSHLFLNRLRRYGTYVPVIEIINSYNIIPRNKVLREFFDFIIYPFTGNDLIHVITKVLDYYQNPIINDSFDVIEPNKENYLTTSSEVDDNNVNTPLLKISSINMNQINPSISNTSLDQSQRQIVSSPKALEKSNLVNGSPNKSSAYPNSNHLEYISEIPPKDSIVYYSTIHQQSAEIVTIHPIQGARPSLLTASASSIVFKKDSHDGSLGKFKSNKFTISGRRTRNVNATKQTRKRSNSSGNMTLASSSNDSQSRKKSRNADVIVNHQNVYENEINSNNFNHDILLDGSNYEGNSIHYHFSNNFIDNNNVSVYNGHVFNGNDIISSEHYHIENNNTTNDDILESIAFDISNLESLDFILNSNCYSFSDHDD